jgi:hypothetical protein
VGPVVVATENSLVHLVPLMSLVLLVRQILEVVEAERLIPVGLES